MMLLNPNKYDRPYLDEKSRELMCKTIEFFETRGKAKLKADDYDRTWYADFLQFVKENGIFAQLLTPADMGDGDTRWDTRRNCEFNEILGFYGLCYWYTWQVSILGLGPLWMSQNKAIHECTVRAVREGGIFAFGLSEQAHGADIYSSDMQLTPQDDGTYLANGSKYYIGNANEAALVSVFGVVEGTGEYVFFAVESRHDNYELVKNTVASQSYVAEFKLNDYPITEAEILSRGGEAWNAALNTVNIGKYNLGWASIGICTHAFYEALNHASTRQLYKMLVTDFPHVKRMFSEAFARLLAMKLFALRASDYMRSATRDDRRYLLYNPMVKMKVTTQGEEVIDLIWDVIAAKGFEKDMYFEMAARDIRALPKLEGTVHVNIALIVKFMPNYFFGHADLPEVKVQNQAANDDFLFDQGPAKGLGKIRFHDYEQAFLASDNVNVDIFREQINVFKMFLATQTPDENQRKDTDFLMELGELFALVVYGQLILENAPHHNIGDDMIGQIFDFLVTDFSRFALRLHGRSATTEAQAELCKQMMRRPVADHDRFGRVWKQVLGLAGSYKMKP
ncbi:MAG TPA: acyl-CoA dehydrogenase [Gammaproteobacteria bacterium]|jgi:acyl-CoA dehydrogenase|nr:acyl-CoA dehydrogenase [Chromatiales bacterium]MCP4925003.1 acyl-CoA dehydrogenase [Gammaproteobacteria bacterium]MDP6095568.1 acyl-CoA dehydrogenase [Gammaproteobacteria bacterium]HJP39424.1 acyl-CoA dehydrogenase [Gammaproteobacteria bacterium]